MTLVIGCSELGGVKTPQGVSRMRSSGGGSGSKKGGRSPAKKRKSQGGTSLQVSQPASKSDKYDQMRDDNNERIINLEKILNDVLEIIILLYEGP